ncbi:hypothetical protein ACJJTC_001491 [Scirpophaga incertulas]
MAYFGKMFKFEKEDKYDELVKAAEKVDTKTFAFLSYKLSQGIKKTGDNAYTLFFDAGNIKRELNFVPGVSFEDAFGANLQSKTTITADGDTFTQVMDFGPKGTITMKREYTADALNVTVTTSFWDGVAVRRYVAA